MPSYARKAPAGLMPSRPSAWVNHDDGVVVELAKAGRTFTDICDALPKRSPRQVRERVVLLGVWGKLTRKERTAVLLTAPPREAFEPSARRPTEPATIPDQTRPADPHRVARFYLTTTPAPALALSSLGELLRTQCPSRDWPEAAVRAEAERAAKALGPAVEKSLRVALVGAG